MSRELALSRLYLGAGIIALYAIAHLSVAASVPALWSPYPAPHLLLITSRIPRGVGLLAFPLLFAAFSVLSVRPYRGKFGYIGVMGLIISLADVVYFAVRGADGAVHQGTTYVAGVLAMNCIALVIFWGTWRATRTRATPQDAVMLNFVLFAWLSWCAFPYFGEVI